MKTLSEFIKTSILGGLFVLLPLVLFYLLLSELLQVVVALATPIADLFPKGTFDAVKMPVVIGVILIVGASFVFGLALRSATLRRSGGKGAAFYRQVERCRQVGVRARSRIHLRDLPVCGKGCRDRRDPAVGMSL
jgi:hypothetical protein